MRHDAQLNLRIVNREQPGARRGNEALPHPPAEFRARGDVLAGSGPEADLSGDGPRLIERGVNAPGFGLTQREGVHEVDFVGSVRGIPGFRQ